MGLRAAILLLRLMGRRYLLSRCACVQAEAALVEDAQMRRRPRAALDGGRAACVVLGLPRRVCCGRGGAFPLPSRRLHVTEIRNWF